MLLPLARYAFVILLIASCIGCDSEGDGDGNGGGNGGGSGGGNAMTATVDGVAFGTDDVATNFAPGFGFVITGIDGDRTIFVSLQGEALVTGTYAMGQGSDPTEYGAGGSFVDGSGAENDVYNTTAGSGQIVLQTFSDEGASGTFSFTATNVAGTSVTVSSGAFDVDF